MTPEQVAIGWACQAAMIAALVGVARRSPRMPSLIGVLLGSIICGQLVLLWPETFFHRWFYQVKEAIYNGLRMWLAVELVFAVFRAWPGARERSKRLLVVALFVAGGVVSLQSRDAEYVSWLPYVITANVWILLCTVGLVEWFRIPLSALHSAVLKGLAFYLLVFQVVIGAFVSHGYEWVRSLGWLEGIACLALHSWWAWVAWRREDVELSPAWLRGVRLEA